MLVERMLNPICLHVKRLQPIGNDFQITFVLKSRSYMILLMSNWRRLNIAVARRDSSFNTSKFIILIRKLYSLYAYIYISMASFFLQIIL